MEQRTKEGNGGTRRRRRGSNVAPLVSPCKAGYVGRVGGRARRERRGPETLPREMRRQTHSSLQRKRSQSLLILVHACRPQRWRKWKGFLSTYCTQGSLSTYCTHGSLRSKAFPRRPPLKIQSLLRSSRRVSQPTNARVPSLRRCFVDRSVEFGMQRRDH